MQLQYEGEVDMLEETYLKIISSKTASLFAAATKVGSILANKENKIKDALEFYGKNLGLTFQIADDTLDYNSELKLFGKKSEMIFMKENNFTNNFALSKIKKREKRIKIII